MSYTVRPIDRWPGEETRRRERSRFKASWWQTSQTLNHELDQLGAKNVVMMLDVQESDIRLDGQLRANAKVGHPGVIIAFESRYGPLRYATDTFDRREDNIRAIALGLEALRKVDRYGITKRGEQYTGWRQLEASTGMSRAEAEQLLASYGSATKALFATHPDRGGDTEEFQRVQEARQLLEVTP